MLGICLRSSELCPPPTFPSINEPLGFAGWTIFLTAFVILIYFLKS